MRVSLIIIAALALCPLLRATEPTELRAALDLFNECVGKIQANAYHQETKSVILAKALHGLTELLGDTARAYDADLSAMSDEAAQSSFEQALQSIAASPGQRRSPRELVESALQAFCKQHDPYTNYIRADDYKMVQLMNKSTGSGIGMTVHVKAGAFFCHPLPGSTAEAAGIKAGDKLLSVEGKPLEGKPLEYIAGLIKGEPGTEVMLRVERTFGRSQNVNVIREAITMPSLIVEKRLAGIVLRLRKFSAELMAETRLALSQLSAGSTLTLDLRGCPGGSLEVAVEFANLFLEPDEPIVTLRSHGQPDEVRKATHSREFKAPAIVLLQDEGTASGAELVIAALLHSPHLRAISQGAKTYGKGVIQGTYDLQGGGHLVLTTGEAIAPQGRGWDGIGLLPSLENSGKIFP